jgi:hypothetical protein
MDRVGPVPDTGPLIAPDVLPFSKLLIADKFGLRQRHKSQINSEGARKRLEARRSTAVIAAVRPCSASVLFEDVLDHSAAV